ncbi:MAG: prolipoprotein diacylglyceryl transferase [Chloroflexi bacterium]|nr:prolipoprotein diacylglyceryl transferase [Chloroflexota bacterium]
MFPILFRTEWFFVYSYTAVFTLGILISMIVYRWQTKKQGSFDPWLVMISFALISGRVGFVISQWSYFQERPSTLTQFWQGGFAYHPALIAGLGGLWLYCWWGKRPFLQTINTFAATLALMSTFGWVACLLEGCAYGAETTIGPFAADLPDTFGVYAVRYWTQLFGILSSLFIYLFAMRFKWQLWHVLFWLSLSHLGIGFLRGDTVYQAANIRVDILLDAMLALACLLLIQYQRNIVENMRNWVFSKNPISSKSNE